MKQDLSHIAKHCRQGGSPEDGGGLWMMPRYGITFTVIASWGEGWDHVSVSLLNRIPAWDEMCWVKDLFFEPEEIAVQFHPRASEYKNVHPNCLHLWRCQDEPQPTPPLEFV